MKLMSLDVNMPTGPTAAKESKGKPPNAGMVQGHSWEITSSTGIGSRIDLIQLESKQESDVFFDILCIFFPNVGCLAMHQSPRKKSTRFFMFMSAPDFLGPSEDSQCFIQIY